MKILLPSIFILLILSCTTVKNTEKSLNYGDYETVISNSLNKLKNKKEGKKRQEYVEILESAFEKAAIRDLERVNFLEKENNPANLENIYKTYLSLKRRQNKIKPILPLHKASTGKDAVFNFKNYDNQIIETKDKLSNYLYTNANNLLKIDQPKNVYRNIYEDLNYLEQINPNYKNTRSLINLTHKKGTDYIRVKMRNNTRKIIPRRLENEMLAFDTYGLNNLWSVYHSNPVKNVTYDYTMILDFRAIFISPEKVNERQLVREKIIIDGWKYKLNDDGKAEKDKNGNKIKIDKKKKIRCRYFEFTQFKSAKVTAKVKFIDNSTKQLLENFPLNSEFVFDHIYARHKGDTRALEDELISFLEVEPALFPSNEQMVYDCGENLKNQLKSIIQKQEF